MQTAAWRALYQGFFGQGFQIHPVITNPLAEVHQPVDTVFAMADRINIDKDKVWLSQQPKIAAMVNVADQLLTSKAFVLKLARRFLAVGNQRDEACTNAWEIYHS